MNTLLKRLFLCFCVIALLFSSVGCSNDLTLPKKVENEIKLSYLKWLNKTEYNVEDIIIENYFGNYNDNEVMLIKEVNKGDSGIQKDVVINGIVFSYPFGNREILLWNGSDFFTLSEAFEKNIINNEDLIKIHKLYNKI